MQKKKNIEEKEDVTLSIVETAMAEELKASALYKKISAQLEDKAAKLNPNSTSRSSISYKCN